MPPLINALRNGPANRLNHLTNICKVLKIEIKQDMTERKDLITAIDDFVTIHPEFDPQVREMMKVKSRLVFKNNPTHTRLHYTIHTLTISTPF